MYNINIRDMHTVWGNTVKVVHRLNTNDWLTAESILKHDEYKSRKVSYNKGDVFVDIGSHIGAWGLLMASINPTYKVYCFEPIPENYEIILKTIEVNNLKNMFVYNLAISDVSGNTEKIYYASDDTDFGREHKFVGSMQGGSSDYIEVPTLGLHELLEWVGEKSCRVMKIDCEGCEIKGFGYMKPEELKQFDYIVGEFHPWNTNSKQFFDMFNGLFENIAFKFSPSEEDYKLQSFMFKRIEAKL
jgi:FkbM family methyltransferase